MGCPKAFVLQAIIQLSRNQYMLHDTSIKAWIEKLESVGPDERAVLYAARKEPATIRELAVRLRWEAGRVSARLNALQEPTPAERGTRKRKLGLARIARTKTGHLLKALVQKSVTVRRDA
jgi:hypothetical protein